MPKGTKSFFVDANVLLYALDQVVDDKSRACADWIARLDGKDALVLSPQVLNELINVVLRRRVDVPLAAAHAFARQAGRWCSASTGYAETVKAIELHQRHRFQWFDALLVSSALIAGCAFFLSEDMQHDQLIEGMRIVSPFHATSSDILRSL